MAGPIGFGKRSALSGRPTFGGGASAAVSRPLDGGSGTPQGRENASACDWSVHALLSPKLPELFPAATMRHLPRAQLSKQVEQAITQAAQSEGKTLDEVQLRDTTTVLLNELVALFAKAAPNSAPEPSARTSRAATSKTNVEAAKERVHPLLMERIDASVIAEMPRGELAEQVSEVVSEILVAEKVNLNQAEQRDLVTLLLNDMLGLGPLEPLIADETVTEIMVNGPNTVFIERKGKISLSDVKFRNDAHLLNIAQRIVSAVGRRVDESSPICDARLLDGSRVNVVIPPLAIDGTAISIRKFSKDKLTLEKMLGFGSLSPQMARLLEIAGRCRANILISGGTGSGKTTLLNAVSRFVDPGERVVTIEDAAELQLQQPHVVRLETRPANLEGKGQVTMRDLVKNALRMRPDRIILGEVRGGEAFELLSAMNTGHDGSMGTCHANSPREALKRVENMVMMANLGQPPKAVREQIASSIDVIIQASRLRDGSRRITHITEVVGMEGEVITTQDLYTLELGAEDEHGRLAGQFKSSGLRPALYERAEYYGLGRALMECM